MPGIKQEKAQSTIEFALILPLFMVLCLMVLQLGLVVKTHIILAHSTREGARALAELLQEESQLEKQAGDTDRQEFSLSKAEDTVRAAVLKSGNLDSDKIQVSLQQISGKNLMKVKVSYDADLEIPLVKEFISTLRLTTSVNVID